jgi:hypothetical protein
MERHGGRSWGRVVVVVAVLLAALLVPTGCKRLDLRKLEDLVRSEMKVKTGVEVTSVTCPEKRDLKAGDEFQCDLVMAGNRMFTVNVKQSDDDGNVEWNVPRVVAPTVISNAIAAQAKEKMGPEAEGVTVDCGSLYILGDKGSTFPCTVHPPSGGELAITVTMTDDEGSFSWKSAEPEAAAAPPPAEGAAPPPAE